MIFVKSMAVKCFLQSVLNAVATEFLMTLKLGLAQLRFGWIAGRAKVVGKHCGANALNVDLRMKMIFREWPGNDLSRLTEDDRILHDHLCELLSDRMSEADVCTASVGIWGALSVMRDKLNLFKIESESYQTRIKDLTEAVERGYAIGQELNKVVKERNELKTKLGEQ